jgi:hypothetical protein
LNNFDKIKLAFNKVILNKKKRILYLILEWGFCCGGCVAGVVVWVLIVIVGLVKVVAVVIGIVAVWLVMVGVVADVGIVVSVVGLNLVIKLYFLVNSFGCI